MKHRIVSRISEGPFRYQAWPTVAKAKDGTLFVGASGHRLNHLCPFGTNVLYVSHDEGESWLGPVIAHKSWLDDRDVGLTAWGESTLLLTSFSTAPETVEQWAEKEDARPQYSVCNPLSAGMREMWKGMDESEFLCGSYSKISYDNGKTWSKARPAPVSSPHGPILMEDGSLFFIGTRVHKGLYEAPDLKPEERIQVFKSFDDGETWEFFSDPPIPENSPGGHYEPYAIQMQNGDILAAVRYESGVKPSAPNMKIYSMISHDGGKTWDGAQFLDLCGAPPHLLQHSSGAVVMVYSRRREKMGQYARVSRDFGKTWSKDVLLSPEAPDWDHGYPSSVECENGDIFTVYYQKCEGDDFNSLHSVRWNLDEIE